MSTNTIASSTDAISKDLTTIQKDLGNVAQSILEETTSSLNELGGKITESYNSTHSSVKEMPFVILSTGLAIGFIAGAISWSLISRTTVASNAKD